LRGEVKSHPLYFFRKLTASALGASGGKPQVALAGTVVRAVGSGTAYHRKQPFRFFRAATGAFYRFIRGSNTAQYFKLNTASRALVFIYGHKRLPAKYVYIIWLYDYILMIYHHDMNGM
jgi:hypothetical protein